MRGTPLTSPARLPGAVSVVAGGWLILVVQLAWMSAQTAATAMGGFGGRFGSCPSGRLSYGQARQLPGKGSSSMVGFACDAATGGSLESPAPTHGTCHPGELRLAQVPTRAQDAGFMSFSSDETPGRYRVIQTASTGRSQPARCSSGPWRRHPRIGQQETFA